MNEKTGETKYTPRTIEPSPEMEIDEAALPKRAVKDTSNLPYFSVEKSEDTKPLIFFDRPVKTLLNIEQKTDPLTEEKVKRVDGFIKREIEKRKWRPIIGAYKKVFEEFGENLKLSEWQRPYDKLEILFTGLGGKVKAAKIPIKGLSKEDKRKVKAKIKEEVLEELLNL